MVFENVFDELKWRGFVEQVTDEDVLQKELSERKLTGYIGFDPTADSLHIGSMVPLMALHHLQRHGHRAIAILGGGTAMIGDPSGKTEMRKMLSREAIIANGEKIRRQIGIFVDFSDQKTRPLALDNADWLLKLRYIDFLRDIGRHFSVNRMLAAEAYKIRMETGLSFIEFNYQILQAYDFWVLFREYNCELQMGGNDQWGNILAGTELIRRKEGSDAYGLTFPLLTTAGGQKMGKTASGAIWLDAERTTPYDFYQYWVNVDDRDVIRFMKLFTLLSPSDIAAYEALSGAELRKAKKRLAYEVTAFVHGKPAAEEAEKASEALFGQGGEDTAVPETVLPQEEAEQGIPVSRLFAMSGLARSAGEARRLIRQGGLYIDGKRVDDETRMISTVDFGDEGTLLLRSGKKRYHRIRLQ